MTKLFIPQEWIDQANVDDKVTVSGGVMTVVADGRAYQIEPASRFMQVEGGDADSFQLVGKVKTESQLRSMNADAMEDTVIIDDSVAYKVQPGYAATFQGAGDPLSDVFR